MKNKTKFNTDTVGFQLLSYRGKKKNGLDKQGFKYLIVYQEYLFSYGLLGEYRHTPDIRKFTEKDLSRRFYLERSFIVGHAVGIYTSKIY